MRFWLPLLVLAFLASGPAGAEYSRREFPVGEIELDGTGLAVKVVRYAADGEVDYEVNLDYTDGLKRVRDHACFDLAGWEAFKQGVKDARARAKTLEPNEMVTLDRQVPSVAPDRGATMQFACAEGEGRKGVILVFGDPASGDFRANAALFIGWPELAPWNYDGLVGLCRETDRFLYGELGLPRPTRD